MSVRNNEHAEGIRNYFCQLGCILQYIQNLNMKLGSTRSHLSSVL